MQHLFFIVRKAYMVKRDVKLAERHIIRAVLLLLKKKRIDPARADQRGNEISKVFTRAAKRLIDPHCRIQKDQKFK